MKEITKTFEKKNNLNMKNNTQKKPRTLMLET